MKMQSNIHQDAKRQTTRSLLLFALLLPWLTLLATAQSPATSSTVPTLVNFSGRLVDSNGKPLTGIQGVTFSLCKEQVGGSPLWTETQNVQPDRSGHYTVMLGSASQGGLPASLFASGEARWLGVQAQGQAEQPRVMLLAVPYALKAGDAQTVGGLPASAFMLAAPSGGNTGSNPVSGGPGGSAGPNVGGSGTAGYLAGWVDNNGNLGNSAFFQTGSGSNAKIGLNLKNPLTTLDVNGSGLMRGFLEMATTGFATPTKGFKSNQFNIESSSYNSSSKKYTLQHFVWQAEPTGNNTNNPSATLNLLFNTDPNNPAETGLSISSKGLFNFAPGQTFPGTGNGTITGVTAGTDLTGGGSSGNVTLNLNTTATDARYAQLGISNSFTGNETVSGNVTSGGTVQGIQGFFTNNTGTVPLFSVQNDTSRTDDGMEGVVYSGQNGSAGVFGTALAKTGMVFGVEGAAQSSLGSGVYGVNGAPSKMSGSGSSAGLWGDAGTIGQVGVIGTADTVNAVVGLNNSNSGYGAVVGRNFGTSSLAPGAVGFSNSGAGIGVIGAGFTFSNTFNQEVGFEPFGIVGDSPAGVGVGAFTDTGNAVFSHADSGTAVYGGSNSGTGIVGIGATGVEGDSVSGVGVIGTGQGSPGVYGSNSGASVGAGTFLTSNDSSGFGLLAGSDKGDCFIDFNGSLTCSGNNSSMVRLSDNHWVQVYASQSAENWFDDYGTGRLIEGVASVALDPTFRDTINPSEEYRVFLTPNGDCKGLYTAEKSATGFVVRELGSGKSNITFDYRIVAHRRGYESVRLQDITDLHERVAENLKHLAEMNQKAAHGPAVMNRSKDNSRPAPQIQLPAPLRQNILMPRPAPLVRQALTGSSLPHR